MPAPSPTQGHHTQAEPPGGVLLGPRGRPHGAVPSKGPAQPGTAQGIRHGGESAAPPTSRGHADRQADRHRDHVPQGCSLLGGGRGRKKPKASLKPSRGPVKSGHPHRTTGVGPIVLGPVCSRPPPGPRKGGRSLPTHPRPVSTGLAIHLSRVDTVDQLVSNTAGGGGWSLPREEGG